MPPTLLRRPLAVAPDPAVVFGALARGAESAFWLDSGPGATTGRSYLGLPVAVHRCRDWSELYEVLQDAGSADPEPLPFAGATTVNPESLPSADADTSPRFRLGWVGWLAYELGLPDAPRPTDLRGDAAVLLRVDEAVEFDHDTGTVTLLALDSPTAVDWLARTATTLESLPRGTAAAPTGPAPTLEARPRHDYPAYAAMIEACKATIARGDAYQLCLTNEFAVDVHPDPLETYLALRAASPSHHGGYLTVGGTSLLSSSPEQFLAVTADGRVRSKPIKGTRPRGAGPVDDALLVRELAASQKERAENLMIVDLVRNDLSRVCALGSVAVPTLLEVETYPQVHQLVSTIEGILAEGRNGLDAVAACFPAGSMTGAPKRSAVHTLAALEGGPRGIYSGVFGYFSRDGALDLAMVIRSIVLDDHGATVGAGGGITALSEPVDEVEETRVKAAVLLAVLGAASPEPVGRSAPTLPLASAAPREHAKL
ncbi:anthranilate synthase component I family protein [Herbiconiux sp. CPCC 203407]|uniref:Anthranilate synthase component I family protein n=1 Tax=Herbiconiux oxytropis TaxID=2970915 RepID=A0AA41XA00_9MICO|nr:anthranilate synthase component I family protein [Herbiconiux oxytropis]MCS5720855.1 anthranilate synthase component I family protein [Herbiconiux oxytropis]MCS5724332.1 anthranilate synthase component I family protein [Herbiconiux oxytropis]